VNFINSQNFRGFNPQIVPKLIRIVVEHHPDRRIADPGFLGQVGEWVAEGPLFQPILEPCRHGPFGIHVREVLVKGPSAGFAPEAPGNDGETDPLPVNRKVPDPVLPASETDQVIGTAMDAAYGRRDGLDPDVIVPLGVLDLEDAVGGKIQNVRIYPLSAVNPIWFLFSAGGSIN